MELLYVFYIKEAQLFARADSIMARLQKTLNLYFEAISEVSEQIQ